MSADAMTKLKHFFLGEGSLEEAEYETEEATDPSKRGQNIVALRGAPQAEVLVLEPRSFDDALSIIGHLREKRAVILNLHALPADQEQRLVDFVAGATHALDGHQERVSDHIFTFSPSNVKINAQRQTDNWGLVNPGHQHLAYKVK